LDGSWTIELQRTRFGHGGANPKGSRNIKRGPSFGKPR
jgi:hypothetical protein